MAISKLAVAILILLVAGGVYFAVSGMPATQQVSSTAQQQLALDQCPNTRLTTINLRARNPNNVTVDYNAPGAEVKSSDGKILLATITPTDSSAAYSTATINCPINQANIVMYTRGGNALASNRWTEMTNQDGTVLTGSVAQPNVYVTILQPEIAGFIFGPRNENGDAINITGFASGTDFYQFTNGSTTAQALASGGTINHRLLIRVNVTARQWGSDVVNPITGARITNIVCAEFPTATYSRNNGILLANRQGNVIGSVVTDAAGAVAVPAGLPGADGMDKCWELTRPVTAGDGTPEIGVTIRADLAEPAGGDDVEFRFYDPCYYNGADGTLKAGYADDALADCGQFNDRFTWTIT